LQRTQNTFVTLRQVTCSLHASQW